jgi:hypothetical protein
MMKRSQPIFRHVSQPAARHASQIKAALFLLLPLVTVPSVGQAMPVATASPISTGFSLPSLAGSLQYAVSASQSVSSNYFGNTGINSSTNLSGDLAYIANNQLYPFSTVFSGGRAWSTSDQSSYNFFNLSLSQGVHAQRWTFSLSDMVNYLPGTASTGLSGVPGVGDLGVNPAPTSVNPAPVGGNTGQGVLTGFSTRVSNSSSLSVDRPLTGKTSLNASGTYSLTRFVNNSSNTGNPSNPGLDSNSESGSLSLSHRIDALTSVSGNFLYSRNTFLGNNFGVAKPGFTGQTASVQFAHQFTRKYALSASAGPQWNRSGTPGSPTSLSLFANLSANYNGEFSRAMLGYTRSSNSGFGVVDGATSNSVTFSTSRTFDRVWLCALTAAYTQSAELPSAASLPFTFHTTVAGVQVSRAIVRSLSAYASYTLENQTNQGTAAAVDLFSGLSNVAAFGLTYSPSAIHLGHS